MWFGSLSKVWCFFLTNLRCDVIIDVGEHVLIGDSDDNMVLHIWINIIISNYSSILCYHQNLRGIVQINFVSTIWPIDISKHSV